MFTDTNSNGTLDTGETGVAGRTVFLNNDGTGLAAGSYTVREVLPSGLSLTSPDQKVTVAADQTASGVNFDESVSTPPTDDPDTFVLGPGGTLSGSGATGMLANVILADNQPKNLAATVVMSTTHGNLTWKSDGSFTYKPGPTFQGIDSFAYYASEDGTAGNTVTVTLLSYNASLVDKLYHQVLHRSAEDTPGLVGWTGLIDKGISLDVVAQAIFNSPERLDPLVTGFHEQYLGRKPDPGGLAYWVADWQQMGDPGNGVVSILASKEFFFDAGDTNTGFINLLYTRFLNRPSDPTGLGFWLGLMSSSAPESRLQIASQFYDTPEEHGELVDFLFGEYFKGVTPLPSTAPYVTDLNDGETDTQVELAIIDSPTHSDNPPEPATDEVGRALYPY